MLLSVTDCDPATYPAAISVTRCNQDSCVQGTAAPSGPPDLTGFTSQLYTAQLPQLAQQTVSSSAAVALCAANASATLLGQLNTADCDFTAGQQGLLCATLELILSEGWADDCGNPSLPDVFSFADDSSATFVGFPTPAQLIAASVDGGQLSLCAYRSCSPAPHPAPTQSASVSVAQL